MFRRNADTIQGTGDTRIKSLLDFIKLHFNAVLETDDITLDVINLSVGCFKLFRNNFFAFLFNRLTSLDQLLNVFAAFLTDLGVGTQACQPDLAGIGFHFIHRGRLNVSFFFKVTLAMVHLTRRRFEELPAKESGSGTR